MQIRKDTLVNGQCYHVFSRSIAKFVVFNNAEEFSRMQELVKLYRFANFEYKYSRFIELENESKKLIEKVLFEEGNPLVEIVAYCLMPTHLHFILRQKKDNGISKFMSIILNSYARYFNIAHKRVGPLWAGRFKSVLVSNDEQLLHLTRYLHLNPVSASLIERPEDWPFSSFKEYIAQGTSCLCDFEDLISISPSNYKKFVNDRASYQKELSKIKQVTIDSYTG